MKAYSKGFVTLLLSFSLLIGCSASKDEAVNQSKKLAETTFKEKSHESTKTTNGFSYYLPKGYKVKDQTENNVILLKDGQEYILFVNPREAKDSEALYEELKGAKKAEAKDITSFKKDNEFGYISITPAKEKKYELIVGIGGIKMTTLTTVSDMVGNTEDMMEITNSVQYDKGKATEKETKK
ncbi:hypothetical protein ACNQFZ_15245 [Schinkia sp. CFF1]